MTYIIMSNGTGSRWQNYNNIPKQLIKINNETLLQRTVRLIKNNSANSRIIITSKNKQLQTQGAQLYTPLQDKLEIDRFTYELISDNVCFLYGDTYYSTLSVQTIINTPTNDILFFGNEKRIFAVKVGDSKLMKTHIDNVRQLFLQEKIDNCKGWHLYQSYANLPWGSKKITDKYILINDETQDFNNPNEYEDFLKGNCKQLQ